MQTQELTQTVDFSSVDRFLQELTLKYRDNPTALADLNEMLLQRAYEAELLMSVACQEGYEEVEG